MEENKTHNDPTCCERCVRYARHIGKSGDSGDLYVVHSYWNIKGFLTDGFDEDDNQITRIEYHDEVFFIPIPEHLVFYLFNLIRSALSDPDDRDALNYFIEKQWGDAVRFTAENRGRLEFCFQKDGRIYRVVLLNLKGALADCLADQTRAAAEHHFFSNIFGQREDRDAVLEKMFQSIYFVFSGLYGQMLDDVAKMLGSCVRPEAGFCTDSTRRLLDTVKCFLICAQAFETAKGGGSKGHEISKNRYREILEREWRPNDRDL